MRVLHVLSGDLWAGAEVQAFTLITTLREQLGCEVAAVLMNDGLLADRLRQRGVAVLVLPESRLGAVRILSALRTFMLHWRPDIVHTHRQKENILGSLANRLASRAPSLRTVHGANEHLLSGLGNLHRRILRRFDHWCGVHLQQRVIAVTGELAASLSDVFPPASVVLAENGIDVAATRAQVRPVPIRTGRPGAVHIGIAGRLVAVKRVDLFLECAALLCGRWPERDWRFHVFGDGPLRQSLQARATALGIGPQTTFHGHRDDIIACVAALDVLLMCSDHEGLPMTLLESLAVGTPVVAHAVGGMKEALQGDPAALVQVHEAAHYAERVRAMAGRDRAIAAAAQGGALARYDSRRNAETIGQVYAGMIGESRT